jgi:hypothetical protein
MRVINSIEASVGSAQRLSSTPKSGAAEGGRLDFFVTLQLHDYRMSLLFTFKID